MVATRHWRLSKEVGVAFLATVVIGVSQLIIGVFFGGMIWADVSQSVKDTKSLTAKFDTVVERLIKIESRIASDDRRTHN